MNNNLITLIAASCVCAFVSDASQRINFYERFPLSSPLFTPEDEELFRRLPPQEPSSNTDCQTTAPRSPLSPNPPAPPLEIPNSLLLCSPYLRTTNDADYQTTAPVKKSFPLQSHSLGITSTEDYDYNTKIGNNIIHTDPGTSFSLQPHSLRITSTKDSGCNTTSKNDIIHTDPSLTNSCPIFYSTSLGTTNNADYKTTATVASFPPQSYSLGITSTEDSCPKKTKSKGEIISMLENELLEEINIDEPVDPNVIDMANEIAEDYTKLGIIVVD